MMLWYKTWRETRTRLLLSAVALAWVCFVIVLTQGSNRTHSVPPMPYIEYIWQAVYKGYVRDFFTILVITLGVGSLMQERAQGTAGFTLSLPVSRSRLIGIRALVGLAEVFALALVPAITIAVWSPMTGQSYPLAQSLQFTILWSIGGSAILGITILFSAIVASEYSAWILCFCSVMLYSAAVNITGLQRFPSLDLFKTMSGSGMPYFDFSRHTLSGPLPWISLLVFLAIALSFIALADRLTQRQDY
jgi:ABC-type transport system involved in multi-copper enzyme maturation permease subunit